MKWCAFITILSLLLCLVSCNESQQKNEIKEFMKTTIVIPRKNMYTRREIKNTNSDVSIINYYDENHCSECAIQEIALNEINNTEKYCNCEFVYVFETHKKDTYKLYNKARDSGIKGTVYIDTCKSFRNANPHIPDKGIYHTFVINKNGKVLMVGNPFQNEKMETLLKKVLNGARSSQIIQKQ